MIDSLYSYFSLHALVYMLDGLEGESIFTFGWTIPLRLNKHGINNYTE